LAWQLRTELRNQRPVVAPPHCRVEINQLHQRIMGKPPHPFREVLELQRLLLSLHQLDDFAAHQID
jgi:hypothetical protein